MSKDFNVPPVIFPTGGNPNTAPQRRLPTAPFQPPRSSNPSIPFMSFDIGSSPASTSFSTPQFTNISGTGSTNFDDEPPLLEELGINTKQIWHKTLSILNPFRVKPDLHEQADLSGPFLFLMAFGLFQLLAGKLHFGIILGCLSLIGYCGIVVFVLMGVFVMWSTRVCTGLLVELASYGDEHRGLVAYACFLIYMLFSLLVVF
ncbi:hypothetical protein HanRHA438_Chr08g0340041 [Helianthus annuus]|nr:hypothetical protein HanRHA438_Chr08g0340041 [Helianthus annuus]